MIRFIICYLLVFLAYSSNAQESTFYQSIPSYPSTYNSNNVVIRMIDGLGFRYYWATYELNDANLSFKPSEDGRSLRQTLEHIYELSLIVKFTSKNEHVKPGGDLSKLSFDELRLVTLKNFQKSREHLSNQIPLDSLQLRFNQDAQFPFWNLINGPISDALWHTGQVVMMRRSAGNPIPSGVNVLTGKKKSK